MQPRLVNESEAEHVAHQLQADQITTIGRNRANSVVLRDEHASRFHAEIICEQGTWILRSCKAMNGTRVNNQKIDQPVTLGDGDLIRIGDTRLRFSFDDDANKPRPTQIIEPSALP